MGKAADRFSIKKVSLGSSRMAIKSLLVLGLFLTMAAGPLWAGEKKPVKPSPKDKCPVCGMFVARYPDWFAEIVFKDGSYAVFDGAKDLFKYYFDLRRYAPSKSMADVDSVYVTDYYTLTLIDGFRAYYVIGSDVFGPMGKELIPFGRKEEAEEFKKDHAGKHILTFTEITPAIVKTLD